MFGAWGGEGEKREVDLYSGTYTDLIKGGREGKFLPGGRGRYTQAKGSIYAKGGGSLRRGGGKTSQTKKTKRGEKGMSFWKEGSHHDLLKNEVLYSRKKRGSITPREKGEKEKRGAVPKRLGKGEKGGSIFEMAGRKEGGLRNKILSQGRAFR